MPTAFFTVKETYITFSITCIPEIYNEGGSTPNPKEILYVIVTRFS